MKDYLKNIFSSFIFRMLPDTSFMYEKLGLKSFYGTIARIGVMDKTTETVKDGEKNKEPERIYNKCRKLNGRSDAKDKGSALEYRNAALASGYTA